jgi:hypothetical protein
MPCRIAAAIDWRLAPGEPGINIFILTCDTRSCCQCNEHTNAKEDQIMFFPFRPKPLFHDVQQEMLVEVRKLAYWSYAGLRTCDLVFRVSKALSISLLLAYVIIGTFVDRAMPTHGAEVHQLATTIIPWFLATLGAVMLSQIVYDVLWRQLQPVVRSAVQSIQDESARYSKQ